MLVVEGLTKAFGASKALDDLTLAVPRGQFVGVIGRSGRWRRRPAGESPGTGGTWARCGDAGCGNGAGAAR